MDVTLIVKASNQQCEDLTIKCEPSWTIRRLKGHLTEVYPGKPSTDEQKLIYSGQLLGDSVVLKDVLRQYDGQQAHTVHLVFTPKNSYYGGSGSSSGSRSNSGTKMTSNASTSSSGPSGGAGSSNSSSNSGLGSNSTPFGRNNVGTGVRESDHDTPIDGGNGDGLRQRTLLQTRPALRSIPRPPLIVEQTAALQNLMQQTYMQYLNQYINLINDQERANTLYPTAGAETSPTINPLTAGTQAFPTASFAPMAQPVAMTGYPNLAYYPCMTPTSYAGAFRAASSIPTPIASTSTSNVGGTTASLPGAQVGANFLPPSTLPGTGSASSSPSQPSPSSQVSGAVEAPTSTAEAGTATSPSAASPAVGEGANPPGEAAAADAAPAAAPARARRFPNIVVEEQENNDWLDVFFSMCRVGILMTVIYLYSSPIRCLTVLFIGVMLYLKKHLDRVYQAIDRRIPRQQAAQDGNAVPRDQQPVAALPNNTVPEQLQSPEQQPQANDDASNSETATVAKKDRNETESNQAGTSSQGSSSVNASTVGSAMVPRPRTGPLSRTADPAPAEEQQQLQQQQVAMEQPVASANDDSPPAEQPAAEGQRMTFNDMTSFLGTLVITFFTSIIPDTPAA